MKAATAAGVAEVFNIATGVETSVKHLAELIIELTGRRSKVSYTSNRDIDNIRRRVLNIDRANVRLGYSPAVSLRDGLARTIDWYARSLGRGSGS